MEAHFLPADAAGIVHITADDTILLACPGSVINGVDTETAEATCSSGSSFIVDGKTMSVSSIICSRHPFHTARLTGNTCLDDKKEVEIGFELPERFIRQITLCFDDVTQNTLYSIFDMPRNIGGYQSGYPRPSFIEDDFYDVGTNRVDNLYSRNTQRATINEKLGLSSGDTKYIHSSDDYFLSRGHMTAKADFIYGTIQRATFHFVNVAPQWQTNNGGNWNTLEMSVRNFATDSHDLVVYTGTHGVSTLPHAETGEETELYLYEEDGKTGLPVPEVYWKVAYEPSTQKGIAFVTLNNPYSDNFTKYCTDICDQVTWLNWKPTDQRLGYSVCCEVDELRAAIKNIPTDFEVVDILL